MSKHTSADNKLHIPKSEQPTQPPASKVNLPVENSAPQAPPKGTNANNQFR